MEFKISKAFYAKKALLDTVYWMSGNNNDIVVDETTDFYIIQCNDESNDESIFKSKLNDFNLREEIVNRTGNIKDLIIAKAFYPEHINIDPIGKFDDPVDKDLIDGSK